MAATGAPCWSFSLPPSTRRARASIALLTNAHECALRDELDGTWVVQPLEFTTDGARPVLVLGDTGGEALHRLLGAPMDVGGFLRLATGIGQTPSARICKVAMHPLHGINGGKWQGAGEHLVEGDAERIEVAARLSCAPRARPE
jgi:hypothetical protein